MASRTAASRVKRKNRHQAMGRRRKNKSARRSTVSTAELFAALGEPGKPAPRASLAAAAKPPTASAPAAAPAKPALR